MASDEQKRQAIKERWPDLYELAKECKQAFGDITVKVTNWPDKPGINMSRK